MTLIDNEIFDEYIKIVKRIRPTICIEVGSFDAEFSCYILNNNICDNIYAFEASSPVYDQFKSVIPSKIKYINAAIASYSGLIEFNLQSAYDPALIGSNSIKYRSDNSSIKKQIIDCHSIDDYFLKTINDNDKICLWIDCEGSADEVLKGMENVLNKNLIKSILIETEHEIFWKDSWLHEEVHRYLTSHGMILKKSKFQYIGQTNCIYEKE